MRNSRVAMLIALGLGLGMGTAAALAADTPVRGDVAGRWQGKSSGTDSGPCGAVSFEIQVVGGRVGGRAHSRTDDDKRADWAIFGLIDSTGSVTLETSRLAEPIKRRFEHVVWTGQVENGHLHLTQSAGASCDTKRSVELSRPR